MTNKERIIVSAYTGYLMCDFAEMHKYIEEKLGRPVWTHELGFKEIWDEIREAVKSDFLALCEKSTDMRNMEVKYELDGI